MLTTYREHALKNCTTLHKKFFLALFTIFLLTACTGDNKDKVDNQQDQGDPVAEADVLGLGTTISDENGILTYQTRANSQILLTGKNSDSEYAPIMEFKWEQMDQSGYQLEFIERTDNSVAINIPSVTDITLLEFKLTITDANGNQDESFVNLQIIPADDENHFLIHPGNAANKFFIKAVLNENDSTDSNTYPISFDVVTIAHWIRTDGNNDQMEIHRQSFNGSFPANYTPGPLLTAINDPKNPVFIAEIPPVDADIINKHFETVQRDRRIERYLIDDIVLETQIIMYNNSNKNFALYALDSIDPNTDLNDHIISFSNLTYDNTTTNQVELIASTDSSISLSVTKLLSSLGLENYVSASNYYKLLDPSGQYETLDSWLEYTGFKDDNGNWNLNDVAHATYVNNFDLGFGRDMYSKKDSNGNVYSFVVNYPSIEAAITGLGEFAVVAMEYSENPDTNSQQDKIVKFYAYMYAVRAGGFIRAKSLNFDGRGEKYIPGACTGCHQGRSSSQDYDTVDQADLHASFIPWDIDAFLFSDSINEDLIEATLDPTEFTPEEISAYSKESQEASIRELNLHALSTYTSDPSRFASTIEMVHGWYGDTSNIMPIDELPNETFDSSFTPQQWAAEPEIYHEVFAPHCRMCHNQIENPNKNFDSYNEFINSSQLVNYVYKRGLMPLARLTMDRFWSSIYNSTSAAEILKAHLENLGKTIPDHPGFPIPLVRSYPTSALTISTPIIVDASNSYFSNEYHWDLTLPFGSKSQLTANSGPVTSFQADIPGGEYTLTLTVTNQHGQIESLDIPYLITNRTPISECFTANTSTLTAAGYLDSIPVVNQLTESLGDGSVYISRISEGIYGKAVISNDGQSLSYTLSNPFNRGIDTIYYEVSDADGSTSTTQSGCDDGGNTGYAAIIIDTTPSGGLTPSNLTATVDSIKNTYEIDLTWSAPTGITADSYAIYVSGNPNAIATVNTPTTAYTHTNLAPSTSNTYFVKAIVSGVESNSSNTSSASTLSLTPGNLSGNVISTSQIDLTWTAPTGKQTQYNIYRNNSLLTTSLVNSYSNTGLTSGQTYTYAVSASDSKPQESPKTSTITKTVTPQAPTGLSLSAGALPTSEIQLTWTAPGGIRDAYCIYRDNALIATTTNTSYKDTGLAQYHLYQYYVVALAGVTNLSACAGTQSAASNTSSLRTATTGTTVPTLDSANVDGTLDASKINLSWTAATSFTATSYNVYRNNSLIASNVIATNYADTGLTYNTSYDYKITAMYDPGNNTSIESSASNTLTASTDNLIPSGVTGSASSTTAINVSWTAPAATVDSPNGYTILRNGSPIGTSTSTNFSDSGLSAGTVYSYSIKAKQGSQTSSASASTNIATMPNAPTGVTASRDATFPTTAIDISWTAPAGGSGTYTYKVERATNALFSTNLTTIANGITATSIQNDSVSPGVFYYYRVTATLNSIASAVSSSATVASQPNSITGLTASQATSTTQINLSWTASVGNVSTYKIYRDNIFVTSVAAPTVSYADTGRSPGTSHSYTIYASANSIDSTVSSTANGYTAPNNVTIGTVTGNSTSQVTLTWSAASGASSYYIYDSLGNFIKSAAGTSTAITGLTSYSYYSYKIKAISSANFTSLSFSGTATGRTKVSYANDIGNESTSSTCTACHAATAHQGTTAGGGTVSVKFPACLTTNGQDCSGVGSMNYVNDSYERVLIRDWVSDGSLRNN